MLVSNLGAGPGSSVPEHVSYLRCPSRPLGHRVSGLPGNQSWETLTKRSQAAFGTASLPVGEPLSSARLRCIWTTCFGRQLVAGSPGASLGQVGPGLQTWKSGR